VSSEGVRLYLDLLKRILINLIYQDEPIPMAPEKRAPFDYQARVLGADQPRTAHTKVGLVRLENVQSLAERVLADGVPGDFLEAGVGRGGVTIFMRGLLKIYDCADRNVWVADSFTGLPRSAATGVTRNSFTSPYWSQLAALLERHPEELAEMTELAYAGTTLDDVREHFTRYGLLDGQVRFLRGWFRETLPAAPIERLALLRIDADIYDSAFDVLTELYPRVSPGGFVIIDDQTTSPEVHQAVADFAKEAGFEPNLVRVDDAAVYWAKDAG
jgi:hypothetical protein